MWSWALFSHYHDMDGILFNGQLLSLVSMFFLWPPIGDSRQAQPSLIRLCAHEQGLCKSWSFQIVIRWKHPWDLFSITKIPGYNFFPFSSPILHRFGGKNGNENEMLFHSLLYLKRIVYLISIVFSFMRPKKGLYNLYKWISCCSNAFNILLNFPSHINSLILCQMKMFVFSFISLFYVLNFIFKC